MLPKKWPIAPKTSEFDGLADAIGATGAGGDAGIGGDVENAGGDDGAEARMPPWAGHMFLGAVPARNGSDTARGHDDVASPPVSGSIVAYVIPDGSGKSSGSAGAESNMN